MFCQIFFQIQNKRRLAFASDVIAHVERGLPAGAFGPIYADLFRLYSLVRQRRPQVILEFGSGWSSYFLALALHDNAGGYLYSVDAVEKWADITRRLMPKRLREFCEIRFSETVPAEHDGMPCLRHRSVPDIVANMVYLDGPPLTPERRVAIDLLALEDRFPDDFLLVIDGRKPNAEFLGRYFRRTYRRFDRASLFGELNCQRCFELRASPVRLAGRSRRTTVGGEPGFTEHQSRGHGGGG